MHMQRSLGPLFTGDMLILAAVRQAGSTPPEIHHATGLSMEDIRAGLDRLRRAGRVRFGVQQIIGCQVLIVLPGD